MYFYRFWRTLLGFFGRIIHRIKAEGLENIPPEGRVILISNHLHAIDPMLHAYVIKRDMHFMAKKELFKNKLFGWAISSVGAFPVDRGHADRGAVTTSLAILEGEGMLLIFPEGTRPRNGVTGAFKSGAAAFALKTGACVIPSAMIAPHGLKPFRRVRIIYGKPISPAELCEGPVTSAATKAATEKLRERVLELIREGANGNT